MGRTNKKMLIDDLKNTFPAIEDCLSDYVAFERNNLKSLAVSIFDHWLSNEEAEATIGNLTGPLHEQRNKKRCRLLERISKDSYIVEYDESDKLTVVPFKSEDERKLKIRESVNSEVLVTLYLSKEKILLCGGHDYTDYLYYSPDNKFIDKIKSKVIEEGLHCI